MREESSTPTPSKRPYQEPLVLAHHDPLSSIVKEKIAKDTRDNLKNLKDGKDTKDRIDNPFVSF